MGQEPGIADYEPFAGITVSLTQIAAEKLLEVAALARTARTLGAEGLAERAFQTLLEAEPLLHEAQTLLNASSVMRRHQRGDPPIA